MPAPVTEWTLERLHALPNDGNRHELLDGALVVSPSPSLRHQGVVEELHLLLAPWARPRGFEVHLAPCAIPFSTRRELQPDLFVVPQVDGRRIRNPRDLTRLVLAVEVLSPSMEHHDRHGKRHVYLEEGVAEYWLVDPEGRTVERWRAGEDRPELLADRLSWTPPARAATLDVDLVEFFRRALD